MAIPVNLQQFTKVSGVYSLEFDNSQIPQNSVDLVRLIIGYSKKGPVNTPVYCSDSKFFIDVFGDIDKKLERKGSYWHRSCLQALTRGPILAMNVLITDDQLDVTDFKPMSLSSSTTNGLTAKAPLSEYYNTNKFWFQDPTQLPKIVRNNHPVLQESLFTIANIGKRNISVIIRKPLNTGSQTLGLDVTAKEWYANDPEGVPEFLDENDYISDFLIEVIVFEGSYTDYNKLSLDPIFGNFFDSQGIKKTIIDNFGNELDGVEEFINSGFSRIINRYTGILIPDFIDRNGTNLSIVDAVNSETYLTGLQMYLDLDKFDDEFISGDSIDLLGHTIESEEPNIIDFLSYYGSVNELLTYTENPNALPTFTQFELVPFGSTTIPSNANGYVEASTALTNVNGGAVGEYDTYVIYGPNHPNVLNGTFTSAFLNQSSFLDFVNNTSVNGSYAGSLQLSGTAPLQVADEVHIVEKVVGSDNLTSNDLDVIRLRVSLEDELIGGVRVVNGNYYYHEGVVDTVSTYSLYTKIDIFTLHNDILYSTQANEVYQQVLNGVLTNGDQILISTLPNVYNPVIFQNVTNNDLSTIGVNGIGLLSKELGIVTVTAYTDDTFGVPLAIPLNIPRTFKTLVGDLNESFLTFDVPTTNSAILNNSASGPLGLNGFNGRIKVGDFLVRGFDNNTTKIDSRTGKSRLTRVISVSEDTNPLSSTYKQITVTTLDPIYVGSGNTIERYKLVDNFVTHYKFTDLEGYVNRPEQMPNGTNARMNEIYDVLYNTNLYDALIDTDNINFRYIVDSFNHGIEPQSKYRLAKIAKERINTFAILNAPSVKELSESTNPLFKDNINSDFNPKYIGTGGNLDLNPSNIWTLPSIENGANYCAFYGPNLILSNNVSCPPAALISNNFIDKFFNAFPYSIVAGRNRGLITGTNLVGLEYNFTRKQLIDIEPWGYNSILNTRNVGFVINSNNTAQQNIKSALSSIHVRELLIFIKESVKNILEPYRWELNTAQIRLQIKTQVDQFLTTVLNQGGLFNYQTIMDSRNNSSEIIDNNMAIIDIFVEPVRGLGSLVARYTILKTGSIANGDFQLQG